MKTSKRKPLFITPEMIDGPMMILGMLSEEHRLAIVAIIEKNKAKKEKALKSKSEIN